MKSKSSLIAGAMENSPARYFTTLESPIGVLTLTSDGSALTGLYMEAHVGGADASEIAGCERRPDAAPFRETILQLEEYFAGKRRVFSVPFAAKGTAFQQQVWHALSEIPFGVTCSYADIARRIGNPAGVRAVGLANGRNPISIIVPCHRVIGASGALTGYGGGLERKRWLLQHEGALLLG